MIYSGSGQVGDGMDARTSELALWIREGTKVVFFIELVGYLLSFLFGEPWKGDVQSVSRGEVEIPGLADLQHRLGKPSEGSSPLWDREIDGA
jgi:hypothetical protein